MRDYLGITESSKYKIDRPQQARYRLPEFTTQNSEASGDYPKQCILKDDINEHGYKSIQSMALVNRGNNSKNSTDNRTGKLSKTVWIVYILLNWPITLKLTKCE